MNQTTMSPAGPAGVAEYAVEPLRDGAEWDAFVRTADGGTFAHLSGWQSVFETHMRHPATYLAARAADGTLSGILPLVEFRSRLFGSRIISVPYLNDGGPLGEPDAVRLLIDAALGLAHRRSAALELRCRHAPVGHRAEPRKVTVLLDLPTDSEALWNALPSKLRSQVRRPQKAGMTARFGPAELPAFYDVWSRNMRDLGTPVLPRRFFAAAAATFPDEFLVGCVYRGDVPVAAGAGFLFRGEFEITWASSLREHNRDAPNMLLYWSFMEHVIERGAEVFNFGRCTPGEGTHRFKLQWGGESVPLHWVVAPEEASSDAGPGRITRLGSSAWQRLPVRVANAIGPIVARQLPWW
ncbi:MAG TPA: FemAB family XrtA/PEP-CTERM system-associated protein [Longimicrobiales bacterium]|nr:FemAB family XrtA/PEP-CTERM system-associated protein [Longimicrobiales bacterium]